MREGIPALRRRNWGRSGTMQREGGYAGREGGEVDDPDSFCVFNMVLVFELDQCCQPLHNI
jgi:hypothetical protein